MKNKVVRVEFEDKLQDLISIDIDFGDKNDYILGKVIDNQVTGIFNDWYVLSNEPKIGKFVSVSQFPDDDIIEIKYSISKVTEL